MGIAHWDDVQKRRNERGQMAATWSNLGSAAGSSRCGVQRIELQPGEMPTPAHVHGEAEEIFYVLGGSGLTWLDEKAYEIREGDCIVYKNFHEAHTIRAGDDGFDVLAFGAREYTPVGELPRGGSMWTVTGWAEVHTDSHPWDREPPLEWPDPEPERPSTIVNVADVEPDVRGRTTQALPRERRGLSLDGTGSHRARAGRPLRTAARALGRRGDLRRPRRRRHARADAVAARLRRVRRPPRDTLRPPRHRRRAPTGHRRRACVPRRRPRARRRSSGAASG